MKRTLLITSVLLLTGCNHYPSHNEAQSACFSWLREGPKREFGSGGELYAVRECKHDQATRQYLGFENDSSSKVAKRFRY